jgi:hypothetical protein
VIAPPPAGKPVRLDHLMVEPVKSASGWLGEVATAPGRLVYGNRYQSTELGLPPPRSGQSFHPSNRTAILELDPNREIVAIDVERDVDILGVQMRAGRIVEAPDFATG